MKTLLLLTLLLTACSQAPQAPSTITNQTIPPSAIQLALIQKAKIENQKSPSPPQRLDFTVGQPPITLATWLLEPTPTTPSTPPPATILILHGFVGSHPQVENVAAALRDSGYRAILVDLRGHGQSDGHFLTFGAHDVEDLTDLTNQLQQKNLCGPTLGLYGTSYGASSAIMFAGHDPRITAVVAVAPFADLHGEATHLGQTLLLNELLPDDRFSAMIDLLDASARLARIRPAESPLTAITKTKAPILLLHGETDHIVPAESSRQLHAAAPDHTTLEIIPNRSHLALSWDPHGELQARTRTFFDQHLTPSTPDTRPANKLALAMPAQYTSDIPAQKDHS